MDPMSASSRLKPSIDALHRQDLVPRIVSSDLLRGQRMLEIEHAGQRYTLRVTRENKLILTK